VELLAISPRAGRRPLHSVDPYYLTYKAEMLGYHPEVILAGRRINDNMGKFIAEQTIKQIFRNVIP